MQRETPAAENYLVDEKKNKLFIGGSGINSEKVDKAPYVELPGNNKRDMYSFYFTILFNDDNSFKGVQTPSSTEYNLADWNKQFTDLNPKSNKTATSARSSTARKDDFKGTTKSIKEMKMIFWSTLLLLFLNGCQNAEPATYYLPKEFEGAK